MLYTHLCLDLDTAHISHILYLDGDSPKHKKQPSLAFPWSIAREVQKQLGSMPSLGVLALVAMPCLQ